MLQLNGSSFFVSKVFSQVFINAFFLDFYHHSVTLLGSAIQKGEYWFYSTSKQSIFFTLWWFMMAEVTWVRVKWAKVWSQTFTLWLTLGCRDTLASLRSRPSSSFSSSSAETTFDKSLSATNLAQALLLRTLQPVDTLGRVAHASDSRLPHGGEEKHLIQWQSAGRPVAAALVCGCSTGLWPSETPAARERAACASWLLHDSGSGKQDFTSAAIFGEGRGGGGGSHTGWPPSQFFKSRPLKHHRDEAICGVNAAGTQQGGKRNLICNFNKQRLRVQKYFQNEKIYWEKKGIIIENKSSGIASQNVPEVIFSFCNCSERLDIPTDNKYVRNCLWLAGDLKKIIFVMLTPDKKSQCTMSHSFSSQLVGKKRKDEGSIDWSGSPSKHLLKAALLMSICKKWFCKTTRTKPWR